MSEEKKTEVVKNRKNAAVHTGIRVLAAVLLLAAGFLLGRLTAQDGLNKQPEPGSQKAEIVVSANENPVRLRYPDENATEPAWLYRVIIEEKAGVDFTIDLVKQIYVDEDGNDLSKLQYTPEQLFESDGQIKGNTGVSFGSGLPVQALSGVKFVVLGTDENGNAICAEQYIPFSKGMAEE